MNINFIKFTKNKNLFYLLLILLINLPFINWIALFPQNPDAAEMFITATRGGLMHPSGFPLAAWLNQLFFLTPFFREPITLSIISFLFHIVNIILVFRISMELGASEFFSFLGAIFYAVNPLILGLGLQGEKFSLLQFLMLTVVFLSLVCIKTKEIKYLPWITLFAALSIAQYLVGVFIIFFWSIIIIFLAKERRLGAKQIISSVLFFILILSIFCLSLPLLRLNPPVWPDWGKPEDISQVISHFLRRDLGYTELHLASNVKNIFTGLEYLIRHIWENFFFLAPFLAIGIIVTLKKNKYMGLAFLIVISSVIVVFNFLTNFVSDNSHGYFERYLALFYLFSYPLLGAGFEEISNKIKKIKKLNQVFIFFLFMNLFINFYKNMPYFKAFPNGLIDVYRKNISHSIGNGDVYVSGSDYETFYGIPWKGGIRFPIVSLVDYQWYRKKVLPFVDPILKPYQNEIRRADFENFRSLLYYIHFKGKSIVSSSSFILKTMYKKIYRQGLLYVVPGEKNVWNEKIDYNLETALNLCRDLSGQEINIGHKGHFFARSILERFSLFYKYISNDKRYPSPLRKEAGSLASKLRPGESPAEWKKYCLKLIIKFQ